MATSKATDLRGAARLATEATAGLVDLVEAMHARIARVPGTDADAGGRTRGITGLVYKSVRGVTRAVGGSVDALLGLLTPQLSGDIAAQAPGREREREGLVAALNGVLGDHLAASANPLATTMALRCAGRALVLEREALGARLPQASGRVLVLLHGLCMNDLQWQREGHDHGAELASEFGCTAVYLHYNSGLPVAANGAHLATLLEQMLHAWPVPVERLVLLCHSMGGLVARSAWHQAAHAGRAWPTKVSDIAFLGTPHHGAPLERAGHWIDLLLGAAPYAAPLARLGKLRSAGITDLRHGSLLDGDGAQGGRHPVLPLPAGVRCWALAASKGRKGGDLKDRLLGDGLVPLASALGRHKDASRTLAFAPERQWTGWGMNHMDLLNRDEVLDVLRQWLGPALRPARVAVA